MEDFIDDTDQPREDVSFHRQFNPDNLEHCYKFPNQIRDPRQAAYEDDKPHFGDAGNLKFMCLKIETMLSLINFKGLKNLSKNSKKL